MKLLKIAVIAGVGAVCAATASACPDEELYGEELAYTSDDLWDAKVHAVAAGGDVDLDTCYHIPGTGNVIEAPDFSIEYVKTERYDLHFDTSAECDTVLLVNDATGAWHFDDDSGDGTSDTVVLADAEEGWIDVWIGTFDSDICDATLTVEAFE
ncbi:MAG: hypothetical protein AAF829_12330 [Pseudomonadota bacterium]